MTNENMSSRIYINGQDHIACKYSTTNNIDGIKNINQINIVGDTVWSIYKKNTEEPMDPTGMLVPGKQFRTAFDYYANYFVRSMDPPSADALEISDVSLLQDKSILTWHDDNQTQYIYSPHTTIYLNPDSSTMFQYCEFLIELDMTGFDTSKVTNMSNMFEACSRLRSINVSNWDTSKVIDMSRMFSASYEISSLDISNFDTSNVENISFFTMATNITYGPKFVNTKLKNLDVSDSRNSAYCMLIENAGNRPNWEGGTWTREGTFTTSGYNDNNGYLTNGKIINELMTEYQMSSFTRTTTAPAASISTIDISRDLDESVLMWYDEPSTTYYWYCQYDKVYMNENCEGMFDYCTYMTSFDFSVFDTSRVVNMSKMFKSCSALTSINMTNINTSQTISMSFMFGGCSALTSIDLSKFDTRNVKIMDRMFDSCSGLVELNLSNFDTSNVVDISGMFAYCSSLTTLDLSNFNTSNVVDMSSLFYSSNNLTNLNISSFNTTNVIDMESMFESSSSLTILDLSNFNTSNVENMRSMFRYCHKLTSITYGNNFTNESLNNLDLEYYSNTSNSMFEECLANKPIWKKGDWSADGTFMLKSPILAKGSVIRQFINNDAIQFIRSINAPDPTVKSNDISSDQNGQIVTWYDSASKIQYWYGDCYRIYFNPYCSGMFENLTSLATVEFGPEFDTRYIRNTSNMFSECSSLISLDLSLFDTSDIVNMNEMFSGCSAVITYGNNFTNDGIINMQANDNTNGAYRMFYNNTKSNKPDWLNGSWNSDGSFIEHTSAKTYAHLTTGQLINDVISYASTFMKSSTPPDELISTIDISKDGDGSVVTWYDDNVSTQYWYSDADIVYMNEDSSRMFYYKYTLTNIDLSGFDSSKTTNMESMFEKCNQLESIKMKKFDTSNILKMNSMFKGCESLTFLDLYTFNTQNVTNMNSMFDSCSSLSIIVYGDSFVNISMASLGDLGTTNGAYRMFYNNTKSNKPDWLNGSWNSDGSFIDQSIESNAYLIDGASFNRIMMYQYGKSFVRSITPPDSTTYTYSISIDGDNSIVTWYDSNVSIQYWYSEADIIHMNPNSSNMFSRCKYESIDLSGFVSSNVTNMSYMFSNCSSLTSLDLSSFNTSKVTNTTQMFFNCGKLTSLDLSSFDTSKVENMKYMFESSSSLVSIIFGSNFTNISLELLTSASSSNGSYNMYNECSANKPNWIDGTWDDMGTFIKS